jgi:hypothetical protein
LRILVACEYSGRVRDAFLAKGHYAISCDLEPTDQPGLHYQGDVLDLLAEPWDLMVAFPPCTHLSKAGARYWPEKQADGRQQAALAFVVTLMSADIPCIAIENPVGKIGTAIRKADQIIQPWQFGEPYYKATCLWLKNLPKLEPTSIVEPKWHWNQDGYASGNGGLHRNPRMRSLTFEGIALAMADQWGGIAEPELLLAA